MTVREIVQAMARRWYITLALVACAALLTGMFIRDGGVYTTRTVVAFMLPAKTSLAQGNGVDDASVITFAGIVATELNNGRPAERYSTDDAPYYGAGVREGVLVTLPNAGNQWVSSFLRAEIEIQIVGRTEDWVHARQEELVDKALRISADQQAIVANPDDQIQASVVPLTAQIEHVAPNRSAQAAAVLAMVAAALIVSGWASVALERRGRRRRSPQQDEPQRSPSRYCQNRHRETSRHPARPPEKVVHRRTRTSSGRGSRRRRMDLDSTGV